MKLPLYFSRSLFNQTELIWTIFASFFLIEVCLINKIHPGTERKFEEDALMYHNRFRRRHKVPSLKLNETLSEMAAKWARKVAENDIIKSSFISNGTDIEENLCMECGFDFNGRNVTLEW